MKIHATALKLEATEKLKCLSCKPKKLTLIHAAVVAAVTVIASLMNIFLNGQVAQSGGLDGMQIKALWETTGSVMELAQTFLLPFWNVGIFYVALRFARGQNAETRDLLGGFHRLGKVLSMLLWQFLLYFGAVLAVMYIGSTLVTLFADLDTLTAALGPYAQMLQEDMTLLEDPDFLRSLPLAQALSAFIVPLLISLVIAVFVLGFLSYRLRLCNYFIMDTPEMGGLSAIRQSFRCMKGNIWAMIKLDLSFWWYYALQFVLLLISVLATVLILLDLPELGELGSIAMQFAYCAGYLVLVYFKGAHVNTTYALAYESLKIKTL